MLALAAFSLLPVAAEAWVQTTTCRETSNTGDPLRCRQGETPIPIYWDVDSVVYRINEAGTSDVSFDEASAAIRRSFDTWNEVSCSGLRLVYGGITGEDFVGFDSTSIQSNSNIVMFVDSGWRHQGDALGLTSVTYDLTTGEIVDADIELNDQNFTFTTSDVPGEVQIDIQNTVTHEAGHVVGFDHSSQQGGTMLASAPPGEISKRELHQDDIDGLCAVYPTGGEGDGEEEGGCGCRTAKSDPSSGLLILLALGWLFIRPKQSKKTPRQSPS